jgi:hypothetical protein
MSKIRTRINQAVSAYRAVEIPKSALYSRVKENIKNFRRMKMKKFAFKTLSAAAAATLIFTVSLNTFDGLASSLSNIPVIGGIAGALTFNTFSAEDKERHYDVTVRQLGIAWLNDEKFEASLFEAPLNEKYYDEAVKLYSDFIAEINAANGTEIINKSLTAGYDVITNDGGLLVIKRYAVETAASAAETALYDNIDLENKVILTLPSLFKDNGYIDIISGEIRGQMKKRAAEGENFNEFVNISENQKFYINAERKLVIHFDKYEIAPGYMGSPEFAIPTEIMENSLIGKEYVR